jgi:hypothetical protein
MHQNKNKTFKQRIDFLCGCGCALRFDKTRAKAETKPAARDGSVQVVFPRVSVDRSKSPLDDTREKHGKKQ